MLLPTIQKPDSTGRLSHLPPDTSEGSEGVLVGFWSTIIRKHQAV